MSQSTLYHNPNCSKSRGALEILENKNVAFEVIEYLKSPLDEMTLRTIVTMIPNEPSELIRKDSHFKELGLTAENYQSVDAVIRLLLEHPKLMQRPIFVCGDRAIIGRPSELVEELL